ncbi:FAM183A and FAM183B related-domain-containing protein [Blastocladiella britannica]|nr:FAM183A and FAM183B related-domain-containing protein [Blastocladiella britannica]
MADKPADSGAPAGTVEKLNTIQKNAILEETIRKQMRRHTLHDHYMLSPNIKKNLVLTAKPNTTTVVPAEEHGDPEYNEFAAKLSKTPREKYSAPQTTSQEYFWHTEQLVPENLINPLFHHPRRASDVTRFPRASK